jgi:hypothetical protein
MDGADPLLVFRYMGHIADYGNIYKLKLYVFAASSN